MRERLSDHESDELRPLVNLCMAGDQAAMVRLVQRYQGQVFGLCYRMLGQRQDAEDAAQETFTRMLKSLDGWDQQRDFEPWLLAIAGNRCRTALAKRGRRPASQPMIDIFADDSDDLQAAQVLAEEVNLALSKIRVEYREAFVLFHEHELSYAEIAESLNCPLGTVKTWVHRARREIIEQLTQRDVLQESRCAM